MKRVYVVVSVVVAVVAMALIGVGVYRGGEAAEAREVARSNQPYLARDHSPQLGTTTAKVHIVEFMDPACSTCRSFYPLVKQMLKNHPNDIRLSVRHVGFHPGSDYVVRVLEASRAQDKYWQTLDALLASQDAWVVNHRAYPDRIWPALQAIGLDVERAKADAYSAEVEARVAQDMKDAKSLHVTATPEFFVNGRPMPSFGYEPLNTLVQDALSAS